MNITGNISGGRLYQPPGHQPYGTLNALPPLVSYSQINVDTKRKKKQKRKVVIVLFLIEKLFKTNLKDGTRNTPTSPSRCRKAKFALHKSHPHEVSFSFVKLSLLNFALRPGFHPLCSAVESL